MMSTASFQLLAFGIIAAIIYNLFGSLLWRQAILLVANALFLYTFITGLQSIVPFTAFLLLGFLCVRTMRGRSSKLLFVTSLFLIVAAFAWLKKYAFLPSGSFLSFSYVTIGLSYILFRVLHLLIDTHSEVLTEPISLVTYLNYTLNFMTLVSGPIERFEEFEKDHLVPTRHPFDWVDTGEGLHRIVTGFFQVTVLSWLLSLFHKSQLTALPTAHGFWEKALIGAAIGVSYAFYLYFNFAGYISIVIGIGRLFRFHLPENFDRPFFADSFIDFWNRWHITLSRWLKTYVYNPLLLASMRRITSPGLEPLCSVFALFCTFFLVGIWHGRTTEFVTFGFLQGLGVAGNQLYQIAMDKLVGRKAYKQLAANGFYQAVSRGLTFTWFTFSLLWFWADWKQLGEMASALQIGGSLCALLLIFLGAAVLLTAFYYLWDLIASFRFAGSPLLTSRYVLTVADTAQMVIAICVVLLFTTHNPELVYDAF